MYTLVVYTVWSVHLVIYMYFWKLFKNDGQDVVIFHVISLGIVHVFFCSWDQNIGTKSDIRKFVTASTACISCICMCLWLRITLHFVLFIEKDLKDCDNIANLGKKMLYKVDSHRKSDRIKVTHYVSPHEIWFKYEADFMQINQFEIEHKMQQLGVVSHKNFNYFPSVGMWFVFIAIKII